MNSHLDTPLAKIAISEAVEMIRLYLDSGLTLDQAINLYQQDSILGPATVERIREILTQDKE